MSGSPHLANLARPRRRSVHERLDELEYQVDMIHRIVHNNTAAIKELRSFNRPIARTVSNIRKVLLKFDKAKEERQKAEKKAKTAHLGGSKVTAAMKAKLKAKKVNASTADAPGCS